MSIIFLLNVIFPYLGILSLKICFELFNQENKIFTSSAVTLSKVTTLDHKIVNDSVEFAALVAFTLRLLSQLEEVLDSLWHSLSK